MKILFILSFCLLLVACNKTIDTSSQGEKQNLEKTNQEVIEDEEIIEKEKKTSYALGEEISLKIGESIKVDDNQIEITFMSVSEDSRCPNNARCFWQGQAKVELSAKLLSGEKQDVELLFMGTTDRITSGLFHDTYTLEGIKLSPYPESSANIAQESYILNIKLNK